MRAFRLAVALMCCGLFSCSRGKPAESDKPSDQSAAPAEPAPSAAAPELKIGQTMPYSGPASAYATIGRVAAAYFKKVNEEGGVGGRKLNFLSVDDAYSPPKTVEQTRKLVEQDSVLLMFGSLGTATNTGVQK